MWRAFETRMTRKEAKDTKREFRGFRALSWFSCFRIPADKELYQRRIEVTGCQIDALVAVSCDLVSKALTAVREYRVRERRQ